MELFSKLTRLKELGVTSFKCEEFSVTFKEEKEASEKEKELRYAEDVEDVRSKFFPDDPKKERETLLGWSSQ